MLTPLLKKNTFFADTVEALESNQQRDPFPVKLPKPPSKATWVGCRPWCFEVFPWGGWVNPPKNTSKKKSYGVSFGGGSGDKKPKAWEIGWNKNMFLIPHEEFLEDLDRYLEQKTIDSNGAKGSCCFLPAPPSWGAN